MVVTVFNVCSNIVCAQLVGDVTCLQDEASSLSVKQVGLIVGIGGVVGLVGRVGLLGLVEVIGVVVVAGSVGLVALVRLVRLGKISNVGRAIRISRDCDTKDVLHLKQPR